MHTDETAITHSFILISKRGILNSEGQFVEKDFVGGNFYLLKWRILIEYDTGTLFAIRKFFKRLNIDNYLFIKKYRLALIN